MRDYVISAVLLALAGLALPYASIGLLAYYWVSFMSVQHLMWEGSDIRFTMVIAIGVLLGYLISVSDKRLFWSLPFTICLLLAIWTAITTIFAISPSHSFTDLLEYLKILLMMFLTVACALLDNVYIHRILCGEVRVCSNFRLRLFHRPDCSYFANCR
jgi:hypothetical protein